MKFLNETTSRGVRERGFEIERDGRPIPAIAWTPEAAQAPTPLVLIGHGGSGHKREDHILSLASDFSITSLGKEVCSAAQSLKVERKPCAVMPVTPIRSISFLKTASENGFPD